MFMEFYIGCKDYVNKNYTCQLGLIDPTIAEVKLYFVLMGFMVHGEVSTKAIWNLNSDKLLH